MPASAAASNSTPPTSVPDDHVRVMSGAPPSKFTDPCDRARAASMKCLDDHGYDRSKCTEAFQAYRDCKKTWLTQRREDRINGREGA